MTRPAFSPADDVAPFHVPGVSFAAVTAELDREAGARRPVYAARVAKGSMTAADADRELALIAAWRADLEGYRTWTVTEAAPTSALAWRDRRAGVLREIALRANVYPAMIAKGSLTSADADHRTRCLAALLQLYNSGFAWTAGNGTPPAHAERAPTPAQRESRAEFAEVLAWIDGASASVDRAATARA